jgi:hypothetical protein
MSDSPSPLGEQLVYYRAVAGEYEGHAIDVPGLDELLSAIDSFRPTGDILELACGSGAGRTGMVGAGARPRRPKRGRHRGPWV